MAALPRIPTGKELCALLGAENYAAWQRIASAIDALYEMDRRWNDGGKKWTYEYKYSRGGKTLCALYAKPDVFGCMLIFGKQERDKVEALRGSLAPETLRAFDDATTYHDGKWVMFGASLPNEDLEALLSVKRRPNVI